MLLHYLEGSRSAIQTDHGLLIKIPSLADVTSRLTGWRLPLFDLKFNVACHTGIKPQAIDAHFHLMGAGEDLAPIRTDVSFVKHDLLTKNSSQIWLATNVIAFSDEIYERPVAHIAVGDDVENENASRMLQKFLKHQANGAFCKQAEGNIDLKSNERITDKNRLLVRVAPIHNGVQVVIPQVLWGYLLYRSHYSVNGFYSERRRK